MINSQLHTLTAIKTEPSSKLSSFLNHSLFKHQKSVTQFQPRILITATYLNFYYYQPKIEDFINEQKSNSCKKKHIIKHIASHPTTLHPLCFHLLAYLKKSRHNHTGPTTNPINHTPSTHTPHITIPYSASIN